jgi:ABC-2 type transport system permease protein
MKKLFTYEWKLLTSDWAVGLLLLIFTLCAVFAIWNGAEWVKFQNDAIAGALAEESARIDSMKSLIPALDRGDLTIPAFLDPRDPGAAGRRIANRYAVLPPGPLAVVSVGQSDLYPFYLKISTDSREAILTAQEIENPLRLLTGKFDLAFVLIFLYPLLILALAYNIPASDKESGTLGLLLSNPVSLKRLVAVRFLLRFVVLTTGVAAIAVLGVLFSGTVSFTGESITKLALLLLFLVVYGALWFSIALFVVSFGRSSAANATVLAVVWLAVVIVLPTVFNLAAKTLYPVPSRVELIDAMRRASKEASEQGSILLAKYFEDHPELARGDSIDTRNFAAMRAVVNEEVERMIAPVLERYRSQLERQQLVIRALRFLSPAIVAQDIVNDIAGSGVDRYKHFLAQVEEYHEEWKDFFMPKILQKAQFREYEKLPEFLYEEEPLSVVTGRVISGAVLLGFPLTVFLLAGIRLFRKYIVV